MTSTEGRAGADDPGAKLVPEWGVAADDQVVVAGVAVLVALLLALGWNAWRSDDGDVAPVATSIVARPDVAPVGDSIGGPGIAFTSDTPVTTTGEPAPASDGATSIEDEQTN